MGPLARGDLRDTLERQLRESRVCGRDAALRGSPRPEGRGYFVTPAVVTGCTSEMPAFREETFGPLAAVMRVGSAEEALSAANDSDFGLGGNIWTRDEERGVALARRMESGGVFVNGMTHSDPRIPFGGVKDSGYGRELSSFGIREFVNVKTIWRPQARPQTPTEHPRSEPRQQGSPILWIARSLQRAPVRSTGMTANGPSRASPTRFAG